MWGGIPVPLSTIDITIEAITHYTLPATHEPIEGPVYVHASLITHPEALEADLNRQVEDTLELSLAAVRGHPRCPGVAVVPLPDAPGAVMLAVRLQYDSETFDEISGHAFELEIFGALYPVWLAWHLTDNTRAGHPTNIEIHTQALRLVIDGVDWNAAMALAEIEVTTQPGR